MATDGTFSSSARFHAASGTRSASVVHEPDDAACVARAQQGDRAAFTTLVRRYQNPVYRFIVRMVGSHDEALELAQDTFVRAWQALAGWQPEAEFRTWLFRIASNAATDALRRRKVVRFAPLAEDFDAPHGDPSPEEKLHAKQQVEAVDAALRRLAPDQREIVVLREIEGMSYEEISATLGVSAGTVKSRLARARQALLTQFRKKDV